MYINKTCYCSRCLKEIEPISTCQFCGFDPDLYDPPKYTLPLDTILNGKYQVGCVIGSGGFGITYSGWDLSLNKPIAVKEFFPHGKVSRDIEDTISVKPNGDEYDQYIYNKGVNWFQREARILAALYDTPNIVHVEDYFKENGTAYIIMEFIRGKSLSSYAKEEGGSLDAAKVLNMMRKPIEALQRVHRYGLIHRDISPENLIIAENKEVYLIDFGAATSIDEDSELKATELFINKYYSPPEQESEKDQGTWTDIYSICATIVRLITGENIPSSAEREQNDTLPKTIHSLKLKPKQKKAILHGLNLNIKNRTENIAIFLNELYDVPLPESEIKKKRQRQLIRKMFIGFVALYILLIIAIVLNFDSLIPDYYEAWVKHDTSKAMEIADNHAKGIYLGGSLLTDYWYHWIGRYGDNENKCIVAKKYQNSTYKNLNPDNEYAQQLLMEAAKEGDSEAINYLGWMYWSGNYVKKPDLDKAVKYFTRSSELGNTDAMTNLAMIYMGNDGDTKEAFRLFTDAAKAGNTNAMFYLGVIYDQGEIIEKDSSKATELILKAAEGGQPDAMAALGNFYLSNDVTTEEGISYRDIPTGLYWLNEADIAGSSVAKYYWGLIYKGEIDISDSIESKNLYKQNPQLAFSYMHEAAQAGVIEAMSELSEMYKTGYGTTEDIDAAEEWANKANKAKEQNQQTTTGD